METTFYFFTLPCRFTVDSATWTIDKQFLWGSALLISPALEEVSDFFCHKTMSYDLDQSLKRSTPKSLNSHFIKFLPSESNRSESVFPRFSLV